MKISSLGYCIKQGFKNIYRNRLFSLASVATISACIFLFGIFFCVARNVDYMVTEVEKNTCLTVFLTWVWAARELSLSERPYNRWTA